MQFAEAVLVDPGVAEALPAKKYSVVQHMLIDEDV